MTLSWLVLFVLSILMQYGSLASPNTALAVHNDGLFELDGNAVAEAAPGDDWSVIDDGAGDPNNDDSADASLFIVDGVPEESFTGGGSKDDLDMSAGGATAQVWAHTEQEVPDKDDIQHAFAALYGDVIYFGADRYSNDGDAQVGFWFFKNGITVNDDGTFSPVHTVGDLLVVSHFTNGGAASTIELYEWVGSGGDVTANGTLDLIATGQTCTNAPAADMACAIANAANATSPWPYDPKQGDDNVFGANAFFEGGLDLSEVFDGEVPCFTGFLVETRASQSVDATLQDFASGAFNTCSSITIVKDANPNDGQDFAYTATGTGLSSFSLDDDADGTLSNTKVFSGLKPGAYSVTETLPVAGWDLTSLVCNDANGSINGATANISLQASENVLCTYTNTKRGSIIVDKITDPSGSSQVFTFDSSYGPDFGLTDAAAPNNSGLLVPGTYSVVELTPAGWDLSSVSCSDGSLNTAINLGPGETVTCTFNNRQEGKIIVVKQTTPDGSFQSFEFDSNWKANFFLTDGQSNDSGLMDPGTYSVAEILPAGWDLTSATCSDGSAVNAIALGAGEVVTCTFNNRQDGRIIVVKQTSPDGSSQSFEFDPSYAANFNLTDGQSNDSGFLDPGTYSVSEIVPAGWTLSSASCNDGSAVGSINVAAGETVTCTFNNVQDGHILVDKVTNPAGDPQSFNFDPSYGPDFGLTDAAAPNDSGFLNPGTYSVAEDVPAGWDLTSATCSDGSDPASISLSAGETVTCTFTNTKRGHIVVDKVTNPSGDTQSFTFTTSGSGYSGFSLTDAAAPNNQEVVPGSYTVSESVPSGWDLTSATCDNGEAPGSVDVGPGETITCTFTNTKRGTIIVEKQTSPDGAAGNFTFTGTAAGTISDNGTIVVSNLVPGTYTSTENDPAPNFDLGAIVCDDAASANASTGNVGTRTSTFRLDPGETVRCVFTNVQRGTITIIKNAVPDDAQDFAFSTTGSGLSGFSLDDDTNATLSNTRTFANVVAGSYSVTEAAVAGWDLTGLTCEGAGGSTGTPAGATANITMTPGGSVTCVFTNSKPNIQVVKTAGAAADGAELVVEPGNVTYTYVVTNNGATPLLNVTVRDDNGTPANAADDFNATCPKTTLAVAESMTCTATVAVAANRTNIATARGSSAAGTNVQDTDDAVVRIPGLPIDKSYVGNTGGTASNGTGIAKVGDTLTYTLAYVLTNGPVTNGVITDTLPNGLDYVVGSATGNAQFTFASYNATTRVLTWTAPTVSTNGSVTYRVTVAVGSFNLPQPLVNTATIDSDQTAKSSDTANVLVQVVLAETAAPTLPPTDTIDGGSQAPSNPGFGLMLALLVIAGVGLVMGYITPKPTGTRRAEVRRR